MNFFVINLILYQIIYSNSFLLYLNIHIDNIIFHSFEYKINIQILFYINILYFSLIFIFHFFEYIEYQMIYL